MVIFKYTKAWVNSLLASTAGYLSTGHWSTSIIQNSQVLPCIPSHLSIVRPSIVYYPPLYRPSIYLSSVHLSIVRPSVPLSSVQLSSTIRPSIVRPSVPLSSVHLSSTIRPTIVRRSIVNFLLLFHLIALELNDNILISFALILSCTSLSFIIILVETFIFKHAFRRR